MPLTFHKNCFRLLVFSSKAIFLLLLLSIPVSAAPVSASPIILADKTSYPLAGHIELLVDINNALDLKDVLSDENQVRFKPLPGFVNRGYTDDTIWVRFSTIRRLPFPHDPVLRLWPAFLDTVIVYHQTGIDPADAASYQGYNLGDHFPVVERPVIDADSAVPLELPLNERRRVYIKIRSTSTVNLSGSIHTPGDYITTGSYNSAYQGGYLAVTIVMAIINMVLFIRLKDRLYLYFSLYLFSLFLSFLPAYGLMALFLPAYVHLLSDYLTGMGSASTLLFFSLFGKCLFNDCGKKWVLRFLSFFALLSGMTALAVPLGFYNKLAPFMFITSLSSIIILTWLSSRTVRQGSEGAFIYLAAFGVSNIGFGVHFLRLLGVVPVAWWNMHAVELASIFNMVLMTLAMTERVNRAESRAMETAIKAKQSAVRLAELMTVDLKEKQEKLATALKNEQDALARKDRFIAMINHEYRNPLAIIQTNISLLEMKISDTATVAPIFSKMKRAMERLVEVLETSMGFERQPGRFRHRSILLSPFLKGLLKESKTLWPDRQLQADIDPLPGKAISGDRTLLKTAFLNLLGNAFNYSASEHPVSLAVRQNEHEVTITITDHGCGIRTEHLERVFEKNFRGSQHSGSGGKGVGLYLVKSVIEQFGGTVLLASTIGKGTAATVTLPLHTSGRMPDLE